MLIGRGDRYKDLHPDIDLSRVDVENRVSRIHAEIKRCTDGFVIEDKGSMNGTFYLIPSL
jgi:pSer/pThr/pTyr-binding forkhead associated (FHA) protein